MDTNKIKNITILVLGAILILCIVFWQRPKVDTHVDEISALHKNNAELLIKNDSLIKANKAIDLAITNINKQLDENTKNLANTQTQITKLKNKKDENNNYVSHLSTNGVETALSNYLENRTKGSNCH